MKRLFEKIGSLIFALWTLGIMAAYFYFYKTYGQFYIDAFLLILFLTAFLIPLFFFISLPSLFQGKQPPIMSWFRRLPYTFSVPVKNLIVIFYGCTASWILLICLLKPDVGISINSIASVFLVTLITLAGFSIGSRLVRRFRLECESFLERFILSILLGFGILTLIIYLAGMTGFLYSTLAYTLVLGILFLFRKEWRTLFSDIAEISIPWRVKPFFTVDNFAIIVYFILFVFATTGLLSQFAAGWDEMHTYQAFPRTYAEAHRIVNFKYWFASGFPQNTEMLYTLGFLLKGFTVSAGLNTVFYFLLPGILILIKRFVFPKASSPVIVLLYALSAIPYLMITVDHKIDLAFWCYTLLATLYLLKFFKTPERKAFFLFAILAGIASGTKYNFFSIILPSFLAVLLFFPREFSLKKRLIHITLLLTIIAICFSPWAVKNIIFSGNPVEPALGDLLSRNDTFFKQIGRSYSEHLKEQVSDSNIFAENQEEKNLDFYLTLPLRLTLNYERRNFSDIVNIGPFFLIFTPVAIVLVAKSRRVRKEAALAFSIILILQCLLWLFFSNLNAWYAVSCLLLMLLSSAYFLEIIRNRVIKIILCASIAALSLATLPTRFDGVFRNSTFFVKENNGKYSFYEAARFINGNHLKGLVWDSIGPSFNYYVDTPESRLVYDYYLHIFHFLQGRYPGDSLVRYLQSLGVSYFIFKESDLAQWTQNAKSAENTSPEASRLFRESIADYIDFRNTYLTEIFRNEDIAIYTFKENVK